MAGNAFKKMAVRFVALQLEALKLSIGVLLKNYRDASSYFTPEMRTQKELAKKVGHITQVDISKLENGRAVPADNVLRDIMRYIDIDATQGPGLSLFRIMQVLRDDAEEVRKLK